MFHLIATDSIEIHMYPAQTSRKSVFNESKAACARTQKRKDEK